MFWERVLKSVFVGPETLQLGQLQRARSQQVSVEIAPWQKKEKN